MQCGAQSGHKERKIGKKKGEQTNLLSNFLNVNVIASYNTVLIIRSGRLPFHTNSRRVDGRGIDVLRISRYCECKLVLIRALAGPLDHAHTRTRIRTLAHSYE